MESLLQIKHLGYQDDELDKPQFKVIRLLDGKDSDVITLECPERFPVEGRPNHNLQDDLRWYLEKFLELPLGGYLETADQVQLALQSWGECCFSKLFQGRARDWFQNARGNGLKNLRLKISSEDPRILAWPWEALVDPEGGILAHRCKIERQLNKLHDPLALPDNLPTDRINILLVIARPYENDVGFHALSRPMVELSRNQSIPVHIDVLRPPSFEQLRKILHTKSGFYHIVHFDGHGGYGELGHPVDSPNVFKGTQGKLIFEDNQGKPNPVEASVLSNLMAEYQIPIMVLNACQSGMIDEQADDAFASVAASLLKAGIRSVVAMGYNLRVSGAQQFVPAFYQRLLNSGNVGEATRAGRQEMLAQAKRVCVLGEYELQDWLVPVLYQQDFPGEEKVLPEPINVENKGFSLPIQGELADALPDEILRLGDYGLIGRGQAIQALERAMHQSASGMLIHGMSGVGKTTLAKGFVHWLRDTGGLDRTLPQLGVFWFSFDGIHSIEYVLNQILEPTYGLKSLAASLDQKYEAALKALHDNRFLLIWDNFESVSGIQGAEVLPLLCDDDREILKRLLGDLKGGKTKILITSRSPEQWLSLTNCHRLPILDGLQGEELWEYCNALISGLGLTIKRDDENYKLLIDELCGNPLAIRAILLRLPDYSAKTLLEDLKEQFIGAEGDESTKRIMAALAVFDRGFPVVWEPILQLIGLHRRHFGKKGLEAILELSGLSDSRKHVDSCVQYLEQSGFIRELILEVYSMHPILPSYLTNRSSENVFLTKSFTRMFASYVSRIAKDTVAERFFNFVTDEANFYQALKLSQDTSHSSLLIQNIAQYKSDIKEYKEAERMLNSLIFLSIESKNSELRGVAHHQLANIKLSQNQTSESEIHQDLAMEYFPGNKKFLAYTLNNKSVLSLKNGDIKEAISLSQQAVKLFSDVDDNKGMGVALHQMGRIFESMDAPDQAISCYEQSISLKKERNDYSGMAKSHHQVAVNYYLKLENLEKAKTHAKKAVSLSEETGESDTMFASLGILGAIEIDNENFIAAEKILNRLLTLAEKINSDHYRSVVFSNMGSLEKSRGKDIESAHWLIKSLSLMDKTKQKENAFETTHGLIIILKVAHQRTQVEFLKLWKDYNLEWICSLDELKKEITIG